jgi:hypothetical protein
MKGSYEVFVYGFKVRGRRIRNGGVRITVKFASLPSVVSLNVVFQCTATSISSIYIYIGNIPVFCYALEDSIKLPPAARARLFNE